MRKLLPMIFMLILSTSAMAQLSEADRDFAIRYLQATHNDINNLVSDLTEEQWDHKPEDGGWSVANCLEHILLTESAFLGMVQGTIQQSEANPSLDLSAIDGTLIGQFANRGTKVKTVDQFEPSGKWTTKQEMLDELERSRTKLIEYLKTTDDDLRKYKIALPGGQSDAYQIFLLISAHSQRHTFQMNEVLTELS
ncbi:MAG: DinB family protein [Balneolaceae bacterium]|nr:DinB family protein [Balneolaceae bacterium]